VLLPPPGGTMPGMAGSLMLRPQRTGGTGMRRVWLLIVPLALATATTVAAQQPTGRDLFDEMPPAEVGERASSLLASIREDIAAIERVEERLATASREDSLVLDLQLFARREQALSDVHDLGDALLELEETGAQAELRERVTAAYEQITPSIWRLIEKLDTRVDEQRAQRQEVSPAERPALEDRIGRTTRHLDRVLELGMTHLTNMAALGQDTTAARTIFGRFLQNRAEQLSGRLQLDLVRAEELASHLEETPDDADAAAVAKAVRKSIARDTASLEKTLGLMDTLDLPTERYRAELVTITQDLASGLLDAKVAVTLIGRAWENFRIWLAESGPRLLIKVLVFLAILFVGRLLARIVRRAVEAALERSNTNLSRLLREMVVASSYNLIMALALMIALSQLGISLGPLLAGFGVVGFILGFAMQDSLSNLAAGMMILVNRPYDVGDLVEVAGAFGKVERMSLVSTGILTIDNQKLVVPNSKIWGDVIKNVTDQDIRRVDMVFGISYSDDIPKAEKILEDILAQNERVLDDPAPMVRVHNLGDSSVDFVVRPWVKTEDYWEVFWETTRAVKMRFDEEGVSIPFPQRDVHIYEERLANRETKPAGGKSMKQLPDTDWQQESAPESPEDGDS
jgi:small conductance mechanosensitive channel